MPPAPPQNAPPLALPEFDRLRRPVWIYDPESRRGLYANTAAVELWDAPDREALLARDFSDLSPAVRTRVERLSQATADGALITERWSFYPGGKPVTVQAAISAWPLPDGRRALLFEAASIDVEPQELRAVEALRHTPTLTTLFDAAGEPTFVNPAAFAAYGEGKVGFAARFIDAEHGAQTLRRVLAGEVIAELCPLRTLAGERWCYLDARLVTDPANGAVSVLLSERDVTAQVEAERALSAAHERAEVAEAKQRFLANMSHELRTPLNSVLGFAGLLGQTGLDPAQSGHLAQISEAGEALTRIINDVIDLSELDDGAVTAAAAPFEPAAMLRDAMALFERAAAAKGLSLRLDVSPGAPASAEGDAGLIGKVVGHYLSNAVKFAGGGEIVLSLAATPATGGAAQLEIAVADQGPGLDAATRARLFRRFTQADDGVRKRFSGGGIGLAIAKELAAVMSGEVGVDSEPGHGARFWLRVTLPVSAASAAAPEPEPETFEDRPVKVLYADDNESNRLLVQTLLTSLGHACETVDDGAQAVTAVSAGDYDLVLMDIQMPVMDGVTASREIRALASPKASIPIIALTANTLADQLAEYAAAGMNDCLAKPVNLIDLATKTALWAAAGYGEARSAA